MYFDVISILLSYITYLIFYISSVLLNHLTFKFYVVGMLDMNLNVGDERLATALAFTCHHFSN